MDKEVTFFTTFDNYQFVLRTSVTTIVNDQKITKLGKIISFGETKQVTVDGETAEAMKASSFYNSYFWELAPNVPGAILPPTPLSKEPIRQTSSIIHGPRGSGQVGGKTSS